MGSTATWARDWLLAEEQGLAQPQPLATTTISHSMTLSPDKQMLTSQLDKDKCLWTERACG